MPSFQPFREVRPGGSISASELNRAFAEIERLSRITAEQPLEVVQDAAGNRVRINRRWERFGKITGSGADPNGGPLTFYSWTSQIDDGRGLWNDAAIDDDVGTLNAFCLNGGSVSVNDIVYLVPAPASPTWVIVSAPAAGALKCVPLSDVFDCVDGQLSYLDGYLRGVGLTLINSSGTQVNDSACP